MEPLQFSSSHHKAIVLKNAQIAKALIHAEERYANNITIQFVLDVNTRSVVNKDVKSARETRENLLERVEKEIRAAETHVNRVRLLRKLRLRRIKLEEDED